MERYLSDIRASLRIFRRSPGLSISAVVALAMGIGFTTTMFSIVRGGTRALPFVKADQLVVVTRTVQQGGYDLDPSMFDYVAWARQLKSFTGLGAFEQWSMNLAGDERRPERRTAARVTPNTFALLGTAPAIGRGLTEDDAQPGAPAVVVLGHDLWQARFAKDSAILGRTIRIDGAPHTVVGVMPPRFGFPVRSAMWLPLTVASAPTPSREASGLAVFGRLRDGVELAQARAELATMASRFASDHPTTYEGLSARAYPFVEMEMAPNTRAVLYLMLAVVSFVLLIACANVSNLLLARAAMRSREVAVRTALGATRARILALHLSESLALAVVGGLVGLAIAQVAVRGFAVATAAIIDAFWIDFRVDGTVLVFATVTTAIAALVAGLLPGLRASAANVAEVLKDSGGGSTGVRIGRLARGLVLAQVALATGLLIMTMNFTRTAVALRAVSMPFDARRIFSGQLGLTQAALGTPEARERVARELIARLDATPGIAASALVSAIPGRGAGNWTFSLDAPPGSSPPTTTTGVAVVTPEFFDVVGARVVRGRGLEWRDGPTAPGATVVNESWVRQYSADRDPIGRRIWVGRRSFDVVGVVPDLQMQDPEDRKADGMYMTITQMRPYVLRLLARTAGDPVAMTPAVRAAVEAVDPELPLFEVRSMYDAIYADKRVLEAFSALFFASGLGALFLTMVGVYGVVAFAVAQRVREIGVRVALGATRIDIVRLVLRQGMTLIAIGTGVGLVIAFGLSRTLAAVTEVLQPASAPTYAAVAAALVATAVVALVRPVRRALALQPMDALRAE